MPVVSSHLLRGVHRAARGRTEVLQVHRLQGVCVSDLPQEDSDSVRRVPQARRQLSHQQPGGADVVAEAVEDTVL